MNQLILTSSGNFRMSSYWCETIPREKSAKMEHSNGYSLFRLYDEVNWFHWMQFPCCCSQTRGFYVSRKIIWFGEIEWEDYLKNWLKIKKIERPHTRKNWTETIIWKTWISRTPLTRFNPAGVCPNSYFLVKATWWNEIRFFTKKPELWWIIRIMYDYNANYLGQTEKSFYKNLHLTHTGTGSWELSKFSSANNNNNKNNKQDVAD